MAITITSSTVKTAPSGARPSRTTIGLGEDVLFSANRAVLWTINGIAIPGRHQRWQHQFLAHGSVRVAAEDAGEDDELQINVVTPSMRIRKIRDLRVPHDIVSLGRLPPWATTESWVGAGMLLELTLTPLEVSFGGLQIREVKNPTSGAWGYYQTRVSSPALAHHPNHDWSPVNHDNQIPGGDLAWWGLRASEMNWPLTPGGFRWTIPIEYQIPISTTGAWSKVINIAQSLTQVTRIDPTSPHAPFRGRVTIWKGGAQVVAVF
jgi:hypothetical protein